MTDRHPISPYPIRMPPELREQLEESARKGSRSLHAEIISRLIESLSPRTLDDVALSKAADLDRDIARLSVESMRLSQVLNELLDKGGNVAGTAEEQEIHNQVLAVSEAFGRIEREKFQKMMQREMLQD